MKTYLTYAGINAVALALFSLVLFFAGFQTEKMQAGQYVQYIGMLIFGIVMILGMREARAQKPENEAFTYGNGIFAAFMIGLFTALFSAIYNFVHFSFVNPDFAQYMIDFIRPQLAAKGVPDNAIQSVVKFYEILFSPIGMAIMSLISWPIWSLLIGLVAAIFTRRRLLPGAETGLPQSS
jgi:hypothetical protein